MPRHKAFNPEAALDAAGQVFWRHGYEATTVQDLVDATGVQRASLYATFGDKHEIFLAALDRYLADFAERRMQALAEAGSRKQAIVDFFEEVARFSVQDGRGLGCLLTNAAVELAPRDAAVVERATAAFGRLEAAFADALAHARAAGEIGAEKDPRALARFLVNALHGLRVTARTAPEPERLRDILRVTLSVLD